MTLLHWYCAVGICLSSANILRLLRESRREKKAVASGARTEPSRPPTGLVERACLLVLAFIAACGLWPVLVLLWVTDARLSSAPETAPPFSVRWPDLLEPHTDDAVACRERVLDPLGAVPDLPFGHLHGAWQAFLDGRQPGQVLWSFAATSRDDYRSCHRRGYVLVGDLAIGAHFIVSERDTVDAATEAAWRRRFMDKQLD